MLDKAQKRFIKKKVKRLGSINKVKKFYNRNDTVSKYAIKLAEEILPEGITRRERKKWREKKK